MTQPIDPRLWIDLDLSAASHMIIVRFLRKIVIEPNGCWVWHGGFITNKNNHRTPRACWRGSQGTAQRIAWRFWRGEVPPGYSINRTCTNDLCVCPSHLSMDIERNFTKYEVRSIIEEQLDKERYETHRKLEHSYIPLSVVNGVLDLHNVERDAA